MVQEELGPGAVAEAGKRITDMGKYEDTKGQRVKIPGRGNPPPGYDKIQATLKKFEEKLRTLESERHDPSKGKHEMHWEVYRVEHQQSRYIYSLYYQRKVVSEELYQWLLKHRFANGELIAKWRKQGYEKLCCLHCIGETVCVCRVPKSVRKTDRDFRCVTCGCTGCASSD